MPAMRYLTRLCIVCLCAFLRLVCVCIVVRRCAYVCYLLHADLTALRGMNYGNAQSVGTDFVSPAPPASMRVLAGAMIADLKCAL